MPAHDVLIIGAGLAGQRAATAAADAGATLTVLADACAGSTPENHAAALQVLGLYPPQITVCTSDELPPAVPPE